MVDTTTGFEIEFNGDGSQTEFDVTSFLISDDDDIDVYIRNESTKAATLKTKTTHYTVSVNESGTFTVTMITAPSLDETLYIVLNKDRTQPADFVVNGKISEQSLELQLDEMARKIKSLEADIKRSIKGPIGFGNGELSSYPAYGLTRINSTQNGFEALTVSELNLSSFTFDWNDLSDGGGSIDAANDYMLIYDSSAGLNKKINPEDLTNAITASNEGAAGVGVFKQKTGNNLEFKNISIGSPKVTVTDDTSNNEIDIDVDSGKILDGEFSSNGICVRTNTETYNSRTITGTSNEIDVSDGNGVSGNPTIGISDNPILPGTGSMTVPKGTTAQAPGSPVAGMIRYDSDTDKFVGRLSSSWINFDPFNINALTGESAVAASDTFGFFDSSANANRKCTLTELTTSLDIDGLTADASPDGAADYIITRDDSAGTNKKVLLNNLPAGVFNINGQTSESAVAGIDEFIFFDSSASANRKCTLTEFTASLDIEGQSYLSSVVSNDEILFSDFSDGDTVKKTTVQDVNALAFNSSPFSGGSAEAFKSISLDSIAPISTCFEYTISLRLLDQATSGQPLNLTISDDNEATYKSSGYQWAMHSVDTSGTEATAGSSSDSKIQLGISSGDITRGTIKVYYVGGGATYITYHLIQTDGSSVLYNVTGFGYLSHSTTSTLDIKLQAGSGNITGPMPTVAINTTKI